VEEKIESAYQLLSVRRGATLDVLARAYRRGSLDVHPDRHPNHADGEAFRALKKAYELLRTHPMADIDRFETQTTVLLEQADREEHAQFERLEEQRKQREERERQHATQRQKEAEEREVRRQAAGQSSEWEAFRKHAFQKPPAICFERLSAQQAKVYFKPKIGFAGYGEEWESEDGKMKIDRPRKFCGWRLTIPGEPGFYVLESRYSRSAERERMDDCPFPFNCQKKDRGRHVWADWMHYESPRDPRDRRYIISHANMFSRAAGAQELARVADERHRAEQKRLAEEAEAARQVERARKAAELERQRAIDEAEADKLRERRRKQDTFMERASKSAVPLRLTWNPNPHAPPPRRATYEETEERARRAAELEEKLLGLWGKGHDDEMLRLQLERLRCMNELGLHEENADFWDKLHLQDAGFVDTLLTEQRKLAEERARAERKGAARRADQKENEQAQLQVAFSDYAHSSYALRREAARRAKLMQPVKVEMGQRVLVCGITRAVGESLNGEIVTVVEVKSNSTRVQVETDGGRTLDLVLGEVRPFGAILRVQAPTAADSDEDEDSKGNVLAAPSRGAACSGHALQVRPWAAWTQLSLVELFSDEAWRLGDFAEKIADASGAEKVKDLLDLVEAGEEGVETVVADARLSLVEAARFHELLAEMMRSYVARDGDPMATAAAAAAAAAARPTIKQEGQRPRSGASEEVKDETPPAWPGFKVEEEVNDDADDVTGPSQRREKRKRRRREEEPELELTGTCSRGERDAELRRAAIDVEAESELGEWPFPVGAEEGAEEPLHAAAMEEGEEVVPALPKGAATFDGTGAPAAGRRSSRRAGAAGDGYAPGEYVVKAFEMDGKTVDYAGRVVKRNEYGLYVVEFADETRAVDARGLRRAAGHPG